MRALKTVIALTFALSLGGCGYNRIQSLDERAEQARSNVGVALQNRNQLIPNLVATVKRAPASCRRRSSSLRRRGGSWTRRCRAAT
jgi:hypothetical protein